MSEVWKCPWCGGEMTEAHTFCEDAVRGEADRIEALEAQHANDCEMIARLREVLSGRTLDETHESFWKEKVRQLEAQLAAADALALQLDGPYVWMEKVHSAADAYREARK